MSRIDLQPAAAQAAITTAQSAGSAEAAATVPAGPVATGALSMIDALAGLVDCMAVTAENTRASAALARTHATGSAATAAVTDLVAIDESNARQLTAVGGRV